MLWARQSAVCFWYFYLVFLVAWHASCCYSDKNWWRNGGLISSPCLSPGKVAPGSKFSWSRSPICCCTYEFWIEWEMDVLKEIPLASPYNMLWYLQTLFPSLFRYERPPWNNAASTGLPGSRSRVFGGRSWGVTTASCFLLWSLSLVPLPN